VSLDELLNCLVAQSVELYVADGRLRFRAPEGAMTDSLRSHITAHRMAIIEHLGTLATTAHGRQRCRNCDQRNWVDEPAKDGRIRTTCGKCGGFIGYRRVDQSMA
jgi:hypothetical protein